ncbi:MAG: TIR domain-containing protein [Xanthobacteraceae bacterium]
MSKVFLAYKRDDLARATAVRDKLEALEVPLFIDLKLIAGDNYISEINDQLDSAVAVLVLWTEAAIRMHRPGQPNFVISEAQRGYARGILVAATFEKIALDHLPVPFNVFQTADLSDWIETGKLAAHRGWQKVLEGLGKKLERPGLPGLAVALESDSDETKRTFIKDNPNDPFALHFVAQLEAVERTAFEQRLATARKRVQQRAKEAEKRLKSCRDQFETQIGELRLGRDFMPPDPVTALEDNVAKLTNQIAIYEGAVDEERTRAERAEQSASRSNDEIAGLKVQIKDLSDRTAALDAKNAAIEELTAGVAARDDQIAKQDSTIASQTSTIAGLTSAVDEKTQALEESADKIRDLSDAVTSLKHKLAGETQRLMTAAGAVAVAAAVVFGIIGRLTAPGPSIQPSANVAALSSHIATLTTQNQSLQARLDKSQSQANDAAAQAVSAAAALNSQIATLTKQNQSSQTQLDKSQSQANDAATQAASAAAVLKSQIATLAAQNQSLQARLDKSQSQAADAATQATSAAATINSQITTLTTQNQALRTQVNQLQTSAAAAQGASAAISPAAQCDALAGYQYDPDRPLNNGFAYSVNSSPDAQTICKNALQTPVIDQTTQRRLLVELGRMYQGTGDDKTMLQYWTDASSLGSGQADYLLGTYAGAHGNPQSAWEKIQQSAAKNNPAALNAAAISQILPDWNNNITVRSLSSGFHYLQQALNADYYRAYYVAGAAYWENPDRDTQDRKTAMYYLKMSWCVKRDNSNSQNADNYYFQKTHQHISCQ